MAYTPRPKTLVDYSCEICGNAFTAIRRGHPRKFCDDCKQESARRRAERWNVNNRKYSKEYYQQNAESVKARVRGHRFAVYGLTREQYDGLLASQGGCCAICGSSTSGTSWADKFAIDHNHACCPGKTSCGHCVRGLLCIPCNSALGMMRDDPARLIAAANYLTSKRGVPASSIEENLR